MIGGGEGPRRVFTEAIMSGRHSLLSLALGSSLVVGLGLTPSAAHAQAKKEPPSCAAISFRPLPPDTTDGELDAGMYRSRFGRIVVKGRVKGGQVETYFVTVNNTAPAAVSGNLPASVAECARAKRLPAPNLAGIGKTAETCRGDRFQVLVNHADNKRYVLLYALQAGTWSLCSAGTA